MAISKSDVSSKPNAASAATWQPGDNLDGLNEAESNAVSASTLEESKKGNVSSIGSLIDYFLRLLSSVRFGLIMLGTLLTCCMIGMLIMQINVEGFQKYYNALSPAKRIAFGRLGFFDIYHSWYFSLLLAITGLNIILASIDRFPTAWQYIKKPKLLASPKFIRAQMFAAEMGYSGESGRLAEEIKGKWRCARFRVRVSEGEGRTTIFAQRYVWNRLGAYAVHVALLTIFTGGFLTNRYGAGGSMEIEPERVSDRFANLQYTLDGPRASMMTLPFKIECLDLQQTLIRPEGGLDAQNTIDWLSFIRIDDNGRKKDLLVHLNNVGNYRGYRFFQSQFSPVASARQVVVSFEPIAGGEAVTAKIRRNEIVDVPGIGSVRFVAFYPDFDIADSGFTPIQSGEYSKPFAQLEILTPNGERRAALALGPQAAAFFDLGKSGQGAKDDVERELSINGRRILLKDFEKVSRAHTLTIQYDPGRTPVYIGFVLLLIALCGVFFFSHQRVWAVIEPSGSHTEGKLYIGGNVNRNRQAYEDTFNRMVSLAIGKSEPQNRD
jgi:ResB protein required for cytochrome c biosynthesis